jgi:acyl-CoA synthetase (AMP-forming)/AMP-acid ligase II
MPIWHSFGVVAGLLAAAACDGELHAFESTPDPLTMMRVIAARAISTLYLNPTLARLLLRAAKRRALPALPSLRRVSIGSASMTREELRAMMATFPAAEFYFSYGLTEMGPRVSTFAAGTDSSPHPLLLESPTRSVPVGHYNSSGFGRFKKV